MSGGSDQTYSSSWGFARNPFVTHSPTLKKQIGITHCG